MGLIAFGIFQANVNGRWIDIGSEIDPDDAPLNYWLEAQQPHRGFPADFEVVDGTCHPIEDDSLRSPDDRSRQYPSWHFLHRKVMLGDHTHSWLSAGEILQCEDAAVVEQQRLLDEARALDPNQVRYAEGDLRVMRDFFVEVRRLAEQYGQVRFVFGITY